MNSNSVARIAIASLALIIWPVGPAFGQESKKPSTPSVAKPTKATKLEHSKNSSAQRDFEEAHKFIEKINSISEPLPRGEFETREAYEARQPSLALDKSVLLRLERGFKDYSYDIDRKLLSIGSSGIFYGKKEMTDDPNMLILSGFSTTRIGAAYGHGHPSKDFGA